jgi:Cupin
MDILAEVLDRVRLGGTLLFHFELGRPWSLGLAQRPYALFHYLSRGSATLALEQPLSSFIESNDSSEFREADAEKQSIQPTRAGTQCAT